MSAVRKIRSTPAATRQRILDAAARTFARSGLSGATTREIAREAGVNEVTLFRHFHSKDRLIAAVVGDTFDRKTILGAPPAAPSGSLRDDLLSHGRRYEKLVAENMPLIRTMIGELQHHDRSCEHQVFRGVLLDLRTVLSRRLTEARDHGELPPGSEIGTLTDLFSAMLFTGVLKRSIGRTPPYSRSHYLNSAVDLFLRGATLHVVKT